MKRLMVVVSTFFIFTLMIPLTQAQNETCSEDGIEDAIDELYASYLGDRSDNITDAAQQLADGIDTILSDCADVADASDNSDSEEMDSVVISGRWLVNWSNEESACPDGSNRSTGLNRPFLMTLTDEGFVATDNYV